MRFRLLALLLPLVLAGCITFSSDSPSPPAANSVVAPSASAACADGAAPPCP